MVDGELFLHTELDPGRLFSPGEFSGIPVNTVFEPATVLSLLAGIGGVFTLKRRDLSEKI